jgi:uncharacterized lipoprotein
MQKYIKVTGIATHDTMILPAFDVYNIEIDPATPFTTCKVQYMNSEANQDVMTITYDSTTDNAQNIAMANFVKDLLVQVQQDSYTKPMLEVDASDFPQTVTNVSGPGAS